MKTVINVILFICAALLLWICVGSIVDDQAVDSKINERKKVVIARLLDIKKAQEAYKELHDTTLYYNDEESGELREAKMGRYADSFDELIRFLKNDRYAEQIIKEGVIQEGAQREGWTEAKVAKHIYELKQQGMSREQISEKLMGEKLPGVWIDTVWADSPAKALYGREDYPIDSLRYIPFSDETTENGEHVEFDLVATVHYKMSIPMNYVMECAAHFNTFLSKNGIGNVGNNKRKNMIQYEEERGAYPGLKIGDIANWNNNAGNWE